MTDQGGNVKEVTALFAGAHDPNSKMCVMEAAAYVAGDPWSDHPECVSPIIASFLRRWNDDLPDDATRTRLLAPLIPVVLGTKGTEESEAKRSWMAFDWLVRECCPAWMDLTESLHPHAKALRDLGPIYDKATMDAAMPTLKSAREASDAALAAAWDAARAAARAAARDAAGAAALDAALAAAGAAAGVAAWDAARAAARAALSPTVTALQESAIQLVHRMAEVERVAFEVKRPLKIGDVLVGVET